jgi:hypothetical protein
MDDFQVPLFYEVKPSLSAEELHCVLHAIRLTPISCVIISNPCHYPQALNLGAEVIYAMPPDAAQNLARSLDSPCVVITGNEILSPIYEDVHEETQKETS